MNGIYIVGIVFGIVILIVGRAYRQWYKNNNK